MSESTDLARETKKALGLLSANEKIYLEYVLEQENENLHIQNPNLGVDFCAKAKEILP